MGTATPSNILYSEYLDSIAIFMLEFCSRWVSLVNDTGWNEVGSKNRLVRESRRISVSISSWPLLTSRADIRWTVDWPFSCTKPREETSPACAKRSYL